MTNNVWYGGGQSEQTGRDRSPIIWEPIWRAEKEGSQCLHFFDDFENFATHISDQNTQQYASYIDTGVTIQQLATIDLSEGEMGVIEVAGNDADNDEGVLQAGGSTGVQVKISDTAGEDFMVVMEARMKKASIADNALAFFLGLAEEGLTAAEALVDDTGAVPDKDLIGFSCQHDNGELVDTVYRKSGGALQTVGTSVDTLVADTWVKLGLVYNPRARSADRIKFYVNGKEQGDKVTGTNIAAATFPDGEELSLLLATKVGAAAESKFQMDWWGVGMLLTK